eukprot:UC4_evm4s197
MAFALIGSLVCSSAAPVSISTWSATSESAIVSVDTKTFSYNISLLNDDKSVVLTLTDGAVGIQCNGEKFNSLSTLDHDNCSRLSGGVVSIGSGTDPTLGSFKSIQRSWVTVPYCTKITTSIRSYFASGGIEFVTDILENTNDTATEPQLNIQGTKEFPSVMMPENPDPPPTPGPPNEVGCSDGTCEGLCNHEYARGCGATWMESLNLRSRPSGHECGSDEQCKAPSDACALGWAPCLSHQYPGTDTETFISKVSPTTCAEVSGSFVAAMSHAPQSVVSCPSKVNYSNDNGCSAVKKYGSEPICCGSDCGIPSCSNALWSGKTRALFGSLRGAGSCGSLNVLRDPQYRLRGILCCRISNTTSFSIPQLTPSHQGPQVVEQEGYGVLSWQSDALRSMVVNLPQPGALENWSGGLTNGPLVLYSTSSTTNETSALVLGPSNSFNTAILTNDKRRLKGGIQGMVTHIPKGFQVRFILCGRYKDGVTSAMFTWGSILQKIHGTVETKLRLSSDPLSRQLHYVTDGGSLLNYCDYWPKCVNTNSCIPMAETLISVSSYHKKIGLNVSVYHVDPFWFSHEPMGGCEEGPFAINMSYSPWHFPQGLRALGINMMLFVQAFKPNNVYNATYEFSGQSVAAQDSARFFQDRFAEFTSGKSTCSALTLDGVDKVYQSSPDRYQSVTYQHVYDKGLANAALLHKLPIRTDQESPGDIMASVQFGARTVSRCTHDADPEKGPNGGDTRWLQLAGNTLFLWSLGVRAFTDVLWTTSPQIDPRWGKGYRPSLVHETISSVLTTGPVGFGDLINGTNASLLKRALRIDGTILKPASAALRVGRYYKPLVGGAEIWAAPSGPAGGFDDSDGRANSFPALVPRDDDFWWWNILATNVDGARPSGTPLKITELWPRPKPKQQYLVSIVEDSISEPKVPCMNGSSAKSCGFSLWDEANDLNIATRGNSVRNFIFYQASPILENGWVLIGDQSKFIPCSPQRFVAVGSSDAPREKDMMTFGAKLRVHILGSPGEKVPVTVISPGSRAGEGTQPYIALKI